MILRSHERHSTNAGSACRCDRRRIDRVGVLSLSLRTLVAMVIRRESDLLPPCLRLLVAPTVDAERVEYVSWWPRPARVLRPGGLLAIDNVLSHPDEVSPFLALLAGDPTIMGTTVAVGKGLHLAWRHGGTHHGQ